MANPEDLSGMRIGTVQVLDRATTTTWRCACDCGRIWTVRQYKLKHGLIKSCGCQRAAAIAHACLKHGHEVGHRSKAMVSYRNMKQRCFDANNPKFKYYGGRGITICEKWKNSFSAFYADMGDPPEGLTLDRIDVNGNYEPANCRWATRAVQTANRRVSKTREIAA